MVITSGFAQLYEYQETALQNHLDRDPDSAEKNVKSSIFFAN
jgi:hypothetical protein